MFFGTAAATARERARVASVVGVRTAMTNGAKQQGSEHWESSGRRHCIMGVTHHSVNYSWAPANLLETPVHTPAPGLNEIP